jgi:oxygen-independent coproporphyrinogen-3 oxidase
MSSKEPGRNRSFPSRDGAREASARPDRSAASSSDADPAADVALYVHLPYCVSKCRYCDFNSYAFTGQDMEGHVDALLAEARMRIPGLRPRSVFLGGGTPSLLPPGLLARLLEDLDGVCGFRASSLETTMEANPESLDEATARAAFEGGVNRLSIGVQSLREDVLRAYDRVHSPEEALRAFTTARSAGFARINLDMIHAFPGQDEREWLENLAVVHALGAEHLSCYELSYEPGTALTRMRDAGRWQAASQEDCARLFELTREANESAGYHAYEVSAFARPGEESLHNLAYWRSLDYVGIGAGAAGWKDGIRRRNLERPERYEAAIAAGRDPVGESERLTAEVAMFDHLMMGLRLPHEGVLLHRVRRATGLDPLQVYRGEIEGLLEDGLLELFRDADGRRMRTTTRGLMLLDHILTRFLPDEPGLSV